MKRSLSLVLTLIMVLNIFPCVSVISFAASTNDLKFVLNDDGVSYSVEARNDSVSGALTIPATFNGYPVTGITKEGFAGCANLTSVTLPNSITSIGRRAFLYCTSLKTIAFSNSITEISYGAFEGCSSIVSVSIPDSVTGIGDYAFEECTSLKTVIIPDSVKTIGYQAFLGCSSLTAISIPDSVTDIGNLAFHNCYNLKTATLSRNISIIGNSMFSNCYKLESIVIPEKVTEIGFAAFADCKNLTYVVLYNKITEIDDQVFQNCNNLINTYYTGNAVEWNNVNISSSHNDNLFKNVVLNFDVSKPWTPVTKTTNENGGVKITWNKVDGATKYAIYRRQGGYKSWILVGSTTGMTLFDKNVKSGIYYVYSVRAYNAAGKYSYFINGNTNTRKYMAVPKLTGISNATNGLYIKWNAVAGVTNGYRVYRRGAGSTYWHYLDTVKTTYYTDTTYPSSGEYYRYTVIADGGYHSKFDTNGLYLKRLETPPLYGATSRKTGIEVNWGHCEGATYYNVYRKTAKSGWTKIATVKGSYAYMYVDKTAKKGVTYTYTVRGGYGNVLSSYYSGISCKDKY